MLLRQIRTGFALLALFTVLTGLVYPLAVTGIAQLLFPDRANGSGILNGDTLVGSELIGQNFRDPSRFWGRPSATGPVPYSAGASSGSNLGPLNPALHETVALRIRDLKAADPDKAAPVPVDLVTASAGGLDPHISPAAALYQTPRVARARGLSEEYLRSLVARYTEERDLGILGEPRTHVLLLNLALDNVSQRGGNR